MVTFVTRARSVRSPWCAQAGYSVLEMLVTVALAGIVTGAAASSFPPMLATFSRQNATAQIASDLRLARERAVTTNGKARVVFSASSYTLRRENPAGSGVYVDDGSLQPLPAGITVSSNPVNPTFDSRGLTTQSYVITLTDRYDNSQTITVTGIGRVNAG